MCIGPDCAQRRKPSNTQYKYVARHFLAEVVVLMQHILITDNTKQAFSGRGVYCPVNQRILLTRCSQSNVAGSKYALIAEDASFGRKKYIARQNSLTHLLLALDLGVGEAKSRQHTHLLLASTTSAAEQNKRCYETARDE